MQQQRTRVELTQYGRRGAPAERIGLAGAATVNMSWRYGGMDVVSTLWVSTAVLYVMRCFTGSQCSDLSNGAASAQVLTYVAQSLGYLSLDS